MQPIPRLASSLILGSLLAGTSLAATHYVDSGAAGANNGSSWTDAWTSIGAISGLSAGDTVYISGGPSGGTRTYSLSAWAPAGGSAGSPITYQIGQDSLHNGTALFTGSGNWIGGRLNYVNILGDAGDGLRHFSLSGTVSTNNDSPYTCAINTYNGGGIANSRIAYVNAGHILQFMRLSPAGPFAEIDHCYSWCIDFQGSDAQDYWAGTVVGAGTWNTGLLYHDNVFYTPVATDTFSTAIGGGDMLDFGGDGVSVYNNVCQGYMTNAAIRTSGEHVDGAQFWNGASQSYIQFYGNHYQNLGSIGIYCEITGSGSYHHVRIFNNVVNCTGTDAIEVEAENVTGALFDDVIVVNNTMDANTGGTWCGSMFGAGTAPGTVFNNCLFANNIYANKVGPVNSSVVQIANVDATGHSTWFNNYTANSLVNNYHLTSAATSLIGQGTNLSSIFTTDFDGNPRPASGPWDIGAFQFSTPGPCTNPTIALSSSLLSFPSILTNTTTTLTFNVTNICGGTLIGNASASAPFSVTAGGSYSLVSNAFQTVTVKYSPTTPSGLDSGSVTLTGGNGASLPLAGYAYALLGLSFASTNGLLSNNVFTVSNQFIYNPNQFLDPVSGAQAYYYLTIPTAGNYVVTNTCIAQDEAHDSFYINFDSYPSEPTNVCDIEPPVTVATPYAVTWRGNGTPTAPQFSPNIWALSAGQHVMIVSSREAYTFIGQFNLSAPPPLPPVRLVSGTLRQGSFR